MGRPWPGFVLRSRTAPLINFLGDDLIVGIEEVFAAPLHLLRKPLGSIAAYRADIIYALDWLFTDI